MGAWSLGLALFATMLLALPARAQAPARPASSGAVAITPDGLSVFVVNPDSGTVSAVATATRLRTGEAAVGPDPRSLALAPDASRLYVTSRGAGTLTVLDAGTLAVLATIRVGAEPYGVVADPVRPGVVYVAASARNWIEVIDVPGRRIAARIPVLTKPMGLAISSDGARLYVTHFLTGRVSVIDTALRSVRKVISTGFDSNMAQKILIDEASGRAYLPHVQSNVNDPSRVLRFDSTIFPVVSVLDLAQERHLPLERLHLDIPGRAVNMPFDAALSPDRTRLYVASLGSSDVTVVTLTNRRVKAYIGVGEGPRGIALSADGHLAYVGNSISDDLAVVDLELRRRIARVPVTTTPLSPRLKRGQTLFFVSRTRNIADERWMSCASCHFDGDHDGRTWFFHGRGFRNTTSLRGMADTAPFHWSADRDELQDFEHTIRDLQGGLGLIQDGVPNPPLGAPNAGRSSDLDALAAFIRSLAPRPSPFRRQDGSLTSAAERGRAVFERADVGCATCHPSPAFTDRTVHDVGTGDGPDEGVGPAFDTPSLRMLWDTAPYLHDGSARSLRDVVRARNVQDRHGATSHLTDAEITDLIDYLRSL